MLGLIAHLIPVFLRAFVPKVISGVSKSAGSMPAGVGVALPSAVGGTGSTPGVDMLVGVALVMGLGICGVGIGGVVESGHA